VGKELSRLDEPLLSAPPGGSPVAKRQKIATSNAKVKNSTGLGPGFYLSQGIDT